MSTPQTKPVVDALMRLCDLGQDVDQLATPERPQASKIASDILQCVSAIRLALTAAPVGGCVPPRLKGNAHDPYRLGWNNCRATMLHSLAAPAPVAEDKPHKCDEHCYLWHNPVKAATPPAAEAVAGEAVMFQRRHKLGNWHEVEADLYERAKTDPVLTRDYEFRALGVLAPVATKAKPVCGTHCQNGRADVCLASQSDGVVCPEDSCDLDDGIRSPAPVATCRCNPASSDACVLCYVDATPPAAEAPNDPNGQHCPKCRFTMSGLGYCVNCPAAEAVGEWVRVPRTMKLTPDALEVLRFQCGGVDPGSEDAEERWCRGTLWIGALASEDGEPPTYGLHVANAECPEEGFATLVEFAAAPASPPGVDEEWLPMGSAPRDGTLLRLLVRFTLHPTEDDEVAPTIGSNNFDHDGEDCWQFAGWNWSQDEWTQGAGEPIGWLPFRRPAASEGVQP